jgi:hypothetical protein
MLPIISFSLTYDRFPRCFTKEITMSTNSQGIELIKQIGDEQTEVAQVNADEMERQPWQTPTVVCLAIKRTLNGSGTPSDGTGPTF